MSRLLCTAILAFWVTVVLAGQQTASTPARSRPPIFVDRTAAAGITFVHQSGASAEKLMIESFGSGVAWIDADSDGRPDLFFVNGAPGSANALYRNNGNATFTDITAQAGVAGTTGPAAKAYKTGVAVGDIDNDGAPDLYVTAFGPNTLYRNNGNGTFTDVTTSAGVAGLATDWSTSAGFLDIDRDGDLDLYVANYLKYSLTDNPFCGFRRPGYRMYCSPTMFDGSPDRLFRNNGNGTFTDVSKAAGIANPAGKGLGVAFCDVDGDGNTDIYVANDQVRNFLYRNDGRGVFKDIAYGAGVGFGGNGSPQAGMGVECSDVTGDGRPDIHVTNFEDELNALYVNQGDGTFRDVAGTVGMQSSYPRLGFGTALFDVDNDGDRDVIVANGHVIDNVKLFRASSSFAQKPLLYENSGAGRFRDVTAEGGPALQIERVGRGLAVADFDNDGDLDVAIANQGQAPLLLVNQGSPANNWITLRARGRASNRLGFGAHVEIATGTRRQVGDVSPVGSYQSSHDVRLHFGLGAAKTIDRIVVRWPSGATQTLTNVAANQILDVNEP